jgi:hypothetical protein
VQAPDPRFERAFVAMSYLLGAREKPDLELLSRDAQALVLALGAGSREARARVLAQEVARIALALEQGELRWGA